MYSTLSNFNTVFLAYDNKNAPRRITLIDWVLSLSANITLHTIISTVNNPNTKEHNLNPFSAHAISVEVLNKRVKHRNAMYTFWTIFAALVSLIHILDGRIAFKKIEKAAKKDPTNTNERAICTNMYRYSNMKRMFLGKDVHFLLQTLHTCLKTCNEANVDPLNHLLLCLINPANERGESVNHFAPGT